MGEKCNKNIQNENELRKKFNFYYGKYGEELAKQKATDGAIVFDAESGKIFVNGKAFGAGNESSDVIAETTEDINFGGIFRSVEDGGLGYSEEGEAGTGFGFLNRNSFSETDYLIPAGTPFQKIFEKIFVGVPTGRKPEFSYWIEITENDDECVVRGKMSLSDSGLDTDGRPCSVDKCGMIMFLDGSEISRMRWNDFDYGETKEISNTIQKTDGVRHVSIEFMAGNVAGITLHSECDIVPGKAEYPETAVVLVSNAWSQNGDSYCVGGYAEAPESMSDAREFGISIGDVDGEMHFDGYNYSDNGSSIYIPFVCFNASAGIRTEFKMDSAYEVDSVYTWMDSWVEVSKNDVLSYDSGRRVYTVNGIPGVDTSGIYSITVVKK